VDRQAYLLAIVANHNCFDELKWGNMHSLVIVAHNIRSTHNIGSILRTAEGFGIEHCYLTGYTPFPIIPNDPRLPHLSSKIDLAIAKTALGAEKLVPISVHEDVRTCMNTLKADGYRIVGLEQSPHSIELSRYRPAVKTALLLGEEVAGIDKELLKLCDDIVEIPMHGQKESFNVSVAAGIAMYQLTK
jgi:tRNA G18 (ribose-2'-O)-methylase SpoU